MPLPPKILVVADPAEQHELVAALRAAGEPLSEAVIVAGDGDDETLGQASALRPAVVVIAATLVAGDARSLIGILREALPGVFIVLLADEDGPVKNALDAIDFAVDRFVARPIAAKALRFAVMSGLAAVRASNGRATTSSDIVRPSMIGVVSGRADTADTGPMRQALRKRWETLADSIVSGEEPEEEEIEREMEREREREAETERETENVSAWRPGSTEVPVAPVREPTLVLGEAPPAPGPVDVELIERDDAASWGNASHVAPADFDDDMFDEVAGLDDDLSVDISQDPANAAAVAELGGPPAGGEFARELRRKMSLMAERLFRTSELPPAPVAIGPAHDHHTEIDLGGLVEEPQIGGGTEVYEVNGAVTYVAGFPASPSQTTQTRGTSEAGDIQRGMSDAAALIARMFTAAFTGRIVFRRPPAEKIIHFDNGRPVFASSNLAHDRMGELLLREGKITAEQYARCRELVRETGRRMGEILVERGFLKRRELLPAVRRHVEDVIYSLFAWDQGDYRVIAGDGAPGERIRLSRHPAAMVLEGVRRKLDGATLERLLGPPGTVVETTDRDKLASITGVADLSAEERAALAALDGSTDLATIARQTGAGLTNVYQLAWSLHLLGLATTRRRPGDDESDAPTLVGESDLAIDRARVNARHRLIADADYFALLGVRRDATTFEIKRAYESARRDFAAETFPAELRRELHAELEEISLVLDEAYRVLRDDRLRQEYHLHLRDFVEEAS